jgi:cation diffusion facilitator CzcD-associated flavoprotein CzcO
MNAFSHLPGLPFPEHFPRYIPRDKVVEYLDLYTKHFHIKLNTNEEVVKVDREDGGWKVRTDKEEYQCKYLVIATGYNHKPKFPSWPEIEKFKGKIIHSKEYLNNNGFKGQKVLVVGIGNTGGEIAIDLWEGGAFPSINIRSPLRIVPRDLFGFLPTQFSALIMNFFPTFISDFFSRIILALATENLSRFGIHRPNYGSVKQVRDMEKIPLIDIGTIDLIKQGAIKIIPEIEKFTETGIITKEGKSFEFDSVILCTGYTPGIKDFLSIHDQVLNEKGYPKIKGEETLPGLYFLGFTNHLTGFLRYIGVEAKRIANDIERKSRN